uniref:NAC domain-containing protein 17-like n=1 Tax=Erigeron canadensis TaxID=72917 RepID=UPI001CB94C02|nr:NAC domain-containing protein 17-like [Erigeron canadensis]
MGSDLIQDSVTVSRTKSKSKLKSAEKCFPPGFRFHPTDEELVLYYLKRKICKRSLKLDIIGEVDVYKWDPEELPGQSKLKTGDRQWFFFSPRDRKYPNGGRSSRATMNGYWKATGKDRIIKRKLSSVGIKKTLVYYQGRAPSGLRTDWVMHEYTMDEEELKRCPFTQEHYVLYKIFKKSGPGPKNGEQYGAPFVEEEWSDDDCLDIDSLMVQKRIPVPVNDIREEEDNMLPKDIMEFLNKIIDEPEMLPPLPQIVHKPDNCLIEKAPEKQSLFDEDFLEMNDLIGPDPEICPGQQFSDFGSFSGYDMYHNSGTFGSQPLEFQAAYMDNFDYGPENSGLVSDVVNHDHEVGDELPVSYDLWNHDQGDSSVVTGQMTHQFVSNPSSGVVVEENPGNSEYYINQNPETNMNNNTNSWFSSTLWALVDNIPTNPASASESSALVNKAFERMSSFSRGKHINFAAAATAAANVASGTTNAALKRLEKPKSLKSSSKGIVYFSVLGVLFAILWIFVGSSIEILGIWW